MHMSPQTKNFFRMIDIITDIGKSSNHALRGQYKENNDFIIHCIGGSKVIALHVKDNVAFNISVSSAHTPNKKEIVIEIPTRSTNEELVLHATDIMNNYLFS